MIPRHPKSSLQRALIRSELDGDAQAIIREVTRGLEGELTLTDLTGRYAVSPANLRSISGASRCQRIRRLAIDDGVSSQSLHSECERASDPRIKKKVIELLLGHQYQLNEVGGRIKGTQKISSFKHPRSPIKSHSNFLTALSLTSQAVFTSSRIVWLIQAERCFKDLSQTMPMQFSRAPIGVNYQNPQAFMI